MRYPSTTPITLALLVAVAVAAPHASARIKCWTNNEGVRECGNTVPPEYAQKSYQELSKQGIKVKTTARAKTDEELRKEAEAEKLKKKAAEKRKVRAAKDRVLLATYTTEEEMRLTRDEQRGAIDSRIKHAERIVEDLKRKRELLRAEAAKQELSGKKVSSKLLANIKTIDSRIKKQQSIIKDRHRERASLEARFDADLKRYRELKAGKPVGSP